MSWTDVRHQSAAVRLLRAAVAADRLAHAYLFVGPRGVGKGRAARELAKVLLCPTLRAGGDDGPEACDACDPCRRVERGTHPDLYWFRKEPDRNEFRINLVVRGRGEDTGAVAVTVTESVHLHPMEAARTVTVVDDAELLNREAANALLKVLEEPASHAFLILLCADASRLPGTILSRCQWVRFAPLPEAFVAERLAALLAAEAAEAEKRREPPAPPVSPQETAFVCRFAGGSVEQARRLAGSGLWDLQRRLLPLLADLDEAAALDLAEVIDKWARAHAMANRVTKESREETALKRAAARLALAAAASAFRDASVLAAGAEKHVPLTNAGQRDAVQALAAWTEEARVRAVGLLADAEAQIARYVHTELATENALIQVSRLRPGAAER